MCASKSSKQLIFLLFVAFFFSFQSAAQRNNPSDKPISEEQYELLNTKRESIEKENSADGNEWSGAYQFGDHHPTVFMWSANQGFIAWGSHHTFFPSRLNYGKAEFSNNRLIIKPEIDKDHLNFQYIPAELVPVKWGEQHFLIAPDRLIDFAYAVHSGAESQIVDYLAKSEDYQESRDGLPNLPEQYKRILTMKAIKPKITAVKNVDDAIINSKVTLNLGRADNLIEGMTFYYANSLGGLRITIEDLQEKSSTATITGIFGNGKNDKTPEPKTGMKFTSKIPKDFLDL